MNVLIGADPELFCFDTETGNAVSVHDIVPGSKMTPQKVPFGAIQPDGTAAEFNIEPAATRAEFVTRIQRVSRILELTVKAKNAGYILKAVPTASFSKEYLNNLPVLARELGCEPDYNAYTGEPNPKPDCDLPFRTGSGHIHIGWCDTARPFGEAHMSRCCELVKELDTTLYDFSRCWDSDTKRQELYGKPGAFRPKKYGVEYRVLSNAWLNDEWTIEYVYEAAKRTTELWLHGTSVRQKMLEHTGKPMSEQMAVLSRMGLPTIADFAPEGVIDYVHAA